MRLWGVGRGRGGGLERVSLLETLHIPTTYAILYSLRCCRVSKESTMYTVHVMWCGKAITHKARTLVSAKEWMYKYPAKDLFVKVTDFFGKRVAVRYFR